MRVVVWLRSFVGWLRAGYPQTGDPHGYIPLVALCGAALTDEQVEQVAVMVDKIGAGPVEDVDIRVAITNLSHEMPTDSELRRVRDRLTARRVRPATGEDLPPPSLR
ncbi:MULTISPECIES: DUF3349 domain-containing protein [Rhodococcus]|uniref:DUF3349 domain-containing protein n=1 Tax=Rhodococcus opacus RKJ300 = JCM 13270 TaxID=1165867 RepID=I0WRR8_RHOOP|nr:MULTISPECIES: DUF3349 domain-containing protein [Rhodococcus]EID79084.1 hypothetical protein W59_15546 [Rhodococcus opacus RKJ300 = JCM 13270]KAF0966671.1 hypothetical protein MLGJGCBP_00159 [Rhodococcus sp. T7]QQZ18324.1 DUF3349 domain-containing protein [Rhodococcus sp. 21391]UOT08263.1 DUF3349 domain-containing protein [Rhodococcus opacus]